MNWIEQCNAWKQKWPVMQSEYLDDSDGRLNIYAVLNAINEYSKSTDILMGDAGSISYAGPVALNAKENQRFIFSPAQADMGWALPAAIGVSIASGQNVISIIGDGSFMSNIQELAVARQHSLNIKFIILNNSGYLSIRNTQTKYFDNRIYGTSGETGLWFPNFADVSTTFDIGYTRIDSIALLDTFDVLFNEPGTAIIDCICKIEQEILPAQALKNGKQAGLHDMIPFLSEEELLNEMKVVI
jgi:acetolactate synthase-1/2/3 large subunit